MRARASGVCIVGLCSIAMGACGGSSGGGLGNAGDASPFIGTWNTSGTQVEQCSGATHTDPGSAPVTIGAGPSPGEITTAPGSDCALNWTVQGSVASIAGSQTCATLPGSVGGTWTPTFATGTLTLDATGTVITLTDSGTAVYVNETTQTCTFTQSASYTKS
jgi:hypothetical protein